MQPSRSLTALPLPVRRALRKLGADIPAARKRRRITMQLMADRAFTSRQTVGRLGRGDPLSPGVTDRREITHVGAVVTA